MGQVFSEEDYCPLKDAVGLVIYNAMLEGGAVPDLEVVLPLLLVKQDGTSDSWTRLQDQLKQLQRDIGNRAPAYVKDLIGRLTTFPDKLLGAALVGLVISMAVAMAYTSSRQLSRGKEKVAGSLPCQTVQRVAELQEVMEEYLKRCRINLSHKKRLIEDSLRLEGKLSLILTQLKTCMLQGECDSRSLRHWASGAAFHAQMLVHLAALEGLDEYMVAREALEQYKEDLTQLIPAYREYKSQTVYVTKCRGGLPASHDPPDEIPDEGSMTGLTVMDSETGKSVTLALSTLETETGRRMAVTGADMKLPPSSSISLELITSDQYARAYLDHLFSDKGPVAVLQNYFKSESDNLQSARAQPEVDGTETEEAAEGINAQEQREERSEGDERDAAEEFSE